MFYIHLLQLFEDACLLLEPMFNFLSSQVGSMGFFLTLQSNYQHVMVYESLELQQKARSKLPYEELSAAAVEKLNVAKASDPGTTKPFWL